MAYNGTISGQFKSATDQGERPWGCILSVRGAITQAVALFLYGGKHHEKNHRRQSVRHGQG